MLNTNDEFDEMPEEINERYADVLASQRITMNDIMDHMTGPVLSAVLHIVLLGLLGSIVVFKPPAEKKAITVEMKKVEIKPIEKPPEPPKPPEEVEEQVDVEVDRPDVKTEAVDVEVEAVSTSDNVSQDLDMPDVMSIRPNNSALVLPGVFALRGAAGRRGAIKRYGGSSRTERAVGKGLKWLADHQNSDGSWGENASMSPALTSLALMAFLAHGETPQSPKYGKTVLTAIRKCMEFASTGVGSQKGLIANSSKGYGHAMVAYALSEAYAVTKIPAVKASMNQMLETIVKGMNSRGSYNYRFSNGPQVAGKGVKSSEVGKPRCDLSISGWNYQALKAGFAAGATAEGLEETIEKAITSLKTVNRTANGGFTYVAGRTLPTEGMTSVGVLCLQLFGEKNSKEAHQGLKLLETLGDGGVDPLKMDWKAAGAGPYLSLYTWYYKTQAIFQGYNGKGGAWRKWNTNMKKELLKRQERDGHWSSPAQLFQNEKWRKLGGHGETYRVKAEHRTTFRSELDLYIYSTSLCTLMLEVYYRYLPSFKVVHGKNAAHTANKKDDEDDLNLDI